MGSRKNTNRVYHIETLDIRGDWPVWKWASEYTSLEAAVEESQNLDNWGVIHRIVDQGLTTIKQLSQGTKDGKRISAEIQSS